ncbi:hypothetical protein ACHAWF_014407 [Thalassiosira exigua]
MAAARRPRGRGPQSARGLVDEGGPPCGGGGSSRTGESSSHRLRALSRDDRGSTGWQRTDFFYTFEISASLTAQKKSSESAGAMKHSTVLLVLLAAVSTAQSANENRNRQEPVVRRLVRWRGVGAETERNDSDAGVEEEADERQEGTRELGHRKNRKKHDQGAEEESAVLTLVAEDPDEQMEERKRGGTKIRGANRQKNGKRKGGGGQLKGQEKKKKKKNGGGGKNKHAKVGGGDRNREKGGKDQGGGNKRGGDKQGGDKRGGDKQGGNKRQVLMLLQDGGGEKGGRKDGGDNKKGSGGGGRRKKINRRNAPHDPLSDSQRMKKELEKLNEKDLGVKVQGGVKANNGKARKLRVEDVE